MVSKLQLPLNNTDTYLGIGVLGLASSLSSLLDAAVGHGADRDACGTEDRGGRPGDVDAGDLAEHACGMYYTVLLVW